MTREHPRAHDGERARLPQLVRAAPHRAFVDASRGQAKPREAMRLTPLDARLGARRFDVGPVVAITIAVSRGGSIHFFRASSDVHGRSDLAIGV